MASELFSFSLLGIYGTQQAIVRRWDGVVRAVFLFTTFGVFGEFHLIVLNSTQSCELRLKLSIARSQGLLKASKLRLEFIVFKKLLRIEDIQFLDPEPNTHHQHFTF